MKRIMAMLMSVVLTLGLTACGHTVGDVDLESGQSAVYIQKDGMVSYAVSESFDKDYYDKDELKKEIEAEIKAYNASSDALVCQKRLQHCLLILQQHMIYLIIC